MHQQGLIQAQGANPDDAGKEPQQHQPGLGMPQPAVMVPAVGMPLPTELQITHPRNRAAGYFVLKAPPGPAGRISAGAMEVLQIMPDALETGNQGSIHDLARRRQPGLHVRLRCVGSLTVEQRS